MSNTTSPAESTSGTWTILFSADPAADTENIVTGSTTTPAPRYCGDGYYAAEIDLMEGRTTLTDAQKILEIAYGRFCSGIRPHMALNTATRERVLY